MKRFLNKIDLVYFSFTLVIGLSLLLNACGQAQSPRKPTEFTSVMKSLQLQGLQKNEDSEFSCPPTENIIVKNGVMGSGYDYSGSFDFTVCAHRDDKKIFRVLRAPKAKNICIFPMYSGYDSITKTYTKRLLSAPVCIDLSVEPFADISFTSQEVNYVRITDAAFSNALTTCALDLSGQTTCPTNAEGFVQ